MTGPAEPVPFYGSVYSRAADLGPSKRPEALFTLLKPNRAKPRPPPARSPSRQSFKNNGCFWRRLGAAADRSKRARRAEPGTEWKRSPLRRLVPERSACVGGPSGERPRACVNKQFKWFYCTLFGFFVALLITIDPLDLPPP